MLFSEYCVCRKRYFFLSQHVVKLLLLLYLFKIISGKQVVLLFIFPQYELISKAAVSLIVTTTYLWQLYCHKHFVCLRYVFLLVHTCF